MRIPTIYRLAAASILFAACQSDSYKINGECDNIADGDTIFITNDFSTGQPFAHGVVKDGLFNVEGTIDTPTLCIAYNKTRNTNTTFFVEPGIIKVKLGESASKTKVGGTPMNEKWQDIMDSTLAIGTKMNRIGDMLYNSPDDLSLEERTATVAKMEALQNQFVAFIKRYTDKNITNHFGMFMLLYYRDLLTPDEILAFIKRMPAELQKNAEIQKLTAEMKRKSEVCVGGNLPDFSMNDMDGHPVRLLEVIAKNRLTLIDFWASWCGPCRNEMPNVVALYNEFRTKGFNVIGISLDEDKDKWIAAVKSLNMTWTQLSDLQGWHNQIATAMNVTSIPHTVLVDTNGKILAVGLRGEKLREFVAKSIGD